VTGLLNVLEAAATAGVRKLCFSSSAAVYGDSAVVPKREDMWPEPRSPYGVTKLDGEFYCRHFTEAGRLKTVALRFFNVFGPRQDPAGPYGAAVAVFFSASARGKTFGYLWRRQSDTGFYLCQGYRCCAGVRRSYPGPGGGVQRRLWRRGDDPGTRSAHPFSYRFAFLNSVRVPTPRRRAPLACQCCAIAKCRLPSDRHTG